MRTYVMSPLLSFLSTNEFTYLQIYLSSLSPAPPPPITFVLNVGRQPHPSLPLVTFGTGMTPLLRRPPPPSRSPFVRGTGGRQPTPPFPLFHLWHGGQSPFAATTPPPLPHLLHGTQGSGGPTLHTLSSTFGTGNDPVLHPRALCAHTSCPRSLHF